MPTYAYACTTCDHRFEAQQSFSDDALTDCPECTGRLRKLFNSVGIVFKGSGFYRTDSRKSSSTSSSSGSSESSADSSSKSDSSGSSSTNGSGGASKGAGSSGSSGGSDRSASKSPAPAGSAA